MESLFICHRPGLGRDVVLAKLVRVRGRLVVGVAYRRRARLQGWVSLPKELVERAQQRGAEAIVVRLDQEGRALELPIAAALRLGQLGHVDGLPELWWPLALFKEVEYPDWEYLTPGRAQVIRIGPPPEALPRQLELGLELEEGRDAHAPWHC